MNYGDDVASDMAANNDLLGVIVNYTTTLATLKVLVSFVPLKVYDVNTWKQKTLVEARGLVVDSDVVGDEIFRWWTYYLMRNRTFYGDVIKARLTKGGVINTSIRPVGAIFYDSVPLFGGGNGKTTVMQLGNLHLKIDKKIIRNFNRKIHAAYALTVGEMLLLDEYGDLWIYTTESEGLEEYLVGRYLIDGCYTSLRNNHVWLDREGCVWHRARRLQMPKMTYITTLGRATIVSTSSRGILYRFYNGSLADDYVLKLQETSMGDPQLVGDIDLNLTNSEKPFIPYAR